jgi:hypothetical protein
LKRGQPLARPPGPPGLTRIFHKFSERADAGGPEACPPVQLGLFSELRWRPGCKPASGPKNPRFAAVFDDTPPVAVDPLPRLALCPTARPLCRARTQDPQPRRAPPKQALQRKG